MTITKYIIITVISIWTKLAYCQDITTSMGPVPGYENMEVRKCSGKVVSIDSQYFLVIDISVLNDDTVLIEKSRFCYQAENGNEANIRLYLRKVVRGHYIQLYNGGYPHNDFFTDRESKIEVTKKHAHIDTIAIDEIYPFEIGQYTIQAEIDYFYKGRKFYAWVEDIPFSVAHLPRKSRFNQ